MHASCSLRIFWGATQTGCGRQEASRVPWCCTSLAWISELYGEGVRVVEIRIFQ